MNYTHNLFTFQGDLVNSENAVYSNGDLASLGTVLYVIRKNKELKQNFVAKEIGISHNYLSQIENDKKEPTLRVLVKLCNYYVVNIAFIVKI